MNNDNEIRRNGSGYYDVTAYKAIKNYERDRMDIVCKRGEIWEAKIAGKVKVVLILQTFQMGDYISGIMLYDCRKDVQNPLSVKAISMMYGDAGRVQCIFVKTMVRYIRTLTTQEFDKTLDVVSKALGLEEFEGKSEKTIKKPSEKMLQDREYELYLALLKKERDMFKQLYYELLSRLIGETVGQAGICKVDQ